MRLFKYQYFLLLIFLLGAGAATCLTAGKVEYTKAFKQACAKSHIGVADGMHYITERLQQCSIPQDYAHEKKLQEDIVWLQACLEQVRLEYPGTLDMPLELPEKCSDSSQNDPLIQSKPTKDNEQVFWQSLGFLSKVILQLEEKINKEKHAICRDDYRFHNLSYLILEWSGLKVNERYHQERREKLLQWLSYWPAREWIKHSPHTLVDILSNLYEAGEDGWLLQVLDCIEDVTDLAMFKSLVTGVIPTRHALESMSDADLENKLLHLQAAEGVSRGHPLPYMKLIDFYFRSNQLAKARKIFENYNRYARPHEANYAEDSLHRKIERLFLPLLVKLYALDVFSAGNPEPTEPYAPDEFLFSPELTPKDWQCQLHSLREYDAEISGIKAREFTSVTLVRLDDIYPQEIDRFLNKQPEQLIVVYGKCKRHTHLALSKGITVIGSGSQVSVGEVSGPLLSVPAATITAEKMKMHINHDTWTIGSSEGEIDTDASLYKPGAFPLVYLNRSRLIGVSLNCNGVTQGIVGRGGNLHVANVNIFETSCTGICLHDYDSAKVQDIVLTGKKCDDYDQSNDKKFVGILLIGSKKYWQRNLQKQVSFGSMANILGPFCVDWREK